MLVNEIFHAALTKGNPYVKQELTHVVIEKYAVSLRRLHGKQQQQGYMRQILP